MKKIIIIPTYNERLNIEALIKKIFDLAIEDLHVLVVDDNSPDGTGELVESRKAQYPHLDIIHREKKEGLGRAYVAGFKKALSDGADLIFEMDADFSHSPKYIPEFLAAIQESDLVLGSRYCRGGGVENWNFTRRMVSRFGNIYARTMLSVPIRDLTGGFKCYKRKVLEAINLNTLESVGYNFQIETTYKAYKAGFVIKEIPIIFTERREGKSKFQIKIMLESFLKVLALRFRKHK
ncbi:MAG: Glycosyl transferase family 2 [Parcubacteria group bacterium GW2011_GWA2_38_13]|nr:MAG: Glycosyl transferase family 2 [Parcubacteria group bacterium GW2011_GWA2_38_13]